MKIDKLAKDLTEDKEYLKRCLERNAPQNGLWWGSEETVISVARILNRWTSFSEPSEVIDFFEAPYKFEDKMKFTVEEM